MMAIDKGNTKAMIAFGKYYDRTKHNYDQMKKYYTMAFDEGHAEAMTLLGQHYYYIERNYNNMKKCYMLAIEKGDSEAMQSLGYYYDKHEHNYSEMEKYYKMAIDTGIFDRSIVYRLAEYHEKNKKYDEVIMFCLSNIRRYNYNRRKVSDFNGIIKKYLTHNHIANVIKFLIKLDMDIRVLSTCDNIIDDLYVKLYDITKENSELENEIMELKLRPPEPKKPLNEDVEKDVRTLSLKLFLWL